MQAPLPLLCSSTETAMHRCSTASVPRGSERKSMATAAKRRISPTGRSTRRRSSSTPQEKTITEKELSFEEVVALAYDGNPPTGENGSSR